MTASVLAMRRRNVWEAADSGILLWRENFKFIVLFFALPVGAAAALFCFLFRDSPWWVPWLCLWWLKPFFDRLCLQVVSARFFKAPPSAGPGVSEMRRIFRGMAKTLFSFLAGDLLWRRFSPFRCTVMPLRLMERLRRRQFAPRYRALVPGGLNFGAVLSCVGPPVEAFLLGGEFVFFVVFCQLFVPDQTFFYEFPGGIFPLVFYMIYAANYVLVESLYVCMGFGVYINCRVETEGWDIELLFKKFQAAAKSGAKILLFGFGLLLLPPLHAEARDAVALEPAAAEIVAADYFPADFPSVENVPVDQLNEIMASGDFGGFEPAWRIRLKNQNEEIPEPPETEIPPWLEKLRENLAKILRAVIVALLAGAAGFALVRLRQLRYTREHECVETGTVYANPLIPKGDPKIFFDRAERFFYDGLVRDAWAACLCGALNAFTLYHKISFPPEITEYGCLDLVRERFGNSEIGSRVVNDFADLVRCWVFFAYGQKIPSVEHFEKALMFGRGLEARARQPEAGVA